MFGAARKTAASDPARASFDAVGRFLSEHRLGFDPAAYAFAWRVVTDPTGPLAAEVRALTDGHVRLTQRDVEALGGETTAGAAERTDALIAQTRSQMADFSGLVDRMRAETSDFGRDLAARADQLSQAGHADVLRLTAAMLSRVRVSEAKLADATDEAATLRAELAEARDDARIDPLTGLANRRALVEAYEELARDGRDCCLAVCDVDHFKQVNDRFGHGVGDRVLCAIAGTLANACGDAIVARYGGEEFAVLFPDRPMAAAIGALDRARAAVATKRYRLRDADVVLGTVTFSGGVTEVQAGEGFDVAFARADALLYAAKHDGRNTVRN